MRERGAAKTIAKNNPLFSSSLIFFSRACVCKRHTKKSFSLCVCV